MEGLCGVHRILTGHGVHHQEGFRRGEGFADFPQLLHHVFIDVETAGGIHDHHVHKPGTGMLHGKAGGFHGVSLPTLKHRAIHLPCNDL